MSNEIIYLTAEGMNKLKEELHHLVSVERPAAAAAIAEARDVGSIPGLGRSPGEGIATHSSILAWKIPWTEEPGGLQSMGSNKVRHN